MALSPARASTFLPSIKCSSCNADIPISHMGEHVCPEGAESISHRISQGNLWYTAPVMLPPMSRPLDGPLVSQSMSPAALGSSKSNLPARPRLDLTGHGMFCVHDFIEYHTHVLIRPLQAHSLSSIRLPFASKSSTANSSRSASPASSAAGRKSPFLPPLRSMTAHVLQRPPSTDVAIPQDSPFPTFPTSRAKTPTPTTPSTGPSPIHSQEPSPRPQPTRDVRVPTSDTRTGSNDTMLERMNSIAPGPFNIKADTEGQEKRNGHNKSPSMSSSKDFTRAMSSASLKTTTPRASGSSSVYTRNRSMSTVSGASRVDWDAPAVPAVPVVAREPESQAEPPSEERQTSSQDNHSFDFGPLTPLNRSQTFPDQDRKDADQNPNSSHRRPSEPSSYAHKPKLSVAAAMQPLNSIGSTSSFKPSRSLRRKPEPSSLDFPLPPGVVNHDQRDDKRLVDAPPVPAPVQQIRKQLDSPIHTPHESTSSNGSCSSGARTGSSRSSPPLHESPQRRLQEIAHEDRTDNMFNEFKFGVDAPPQQEDVTPNATPHHSPYAQPSQTVTPHQPSRPPSLSMEPTLPSYATGSMLPSLSIEPTLSRMESPESEQPARKSSTPITSPDDYLVASFDGQSQPQQLHLSAAPPSLTPPPLSPGRPPQRSRPPNKGPCRGCGELITGKSVSSADGRLSGRYHKGCFVCKTCSNPFQTADFYVMRNHPYCGRHYHELNNSICSGCDKGIEGQFLETESRRKFHSYCFTCQDCHKILRDDYFEWNGRTLCERDAFKAAQQPSSALGISGVRRYPERRTTRLMMMM